MGSTLSAVARLKTWLGPTPTTQIPLPQERLRLSGRPLRVPYQGLPYAVELGRARLHIYPELPLLGPDPAGVPRFRLFDPERYLTGMAPFLSLGPGESLTIDRSDPAQRHLFAHPRDAFRRHLQVVHEGHALTFRDPISELGTYVTLLRDEASAGRLVNRRRVALERLQALYGDLDAGPLPPAEALDRLQAVNALMAREPYRAAGDDGAPGALLEPPRDLTPIIVGDLHGQYDNLLKVLTEGRVLDLLESGRAYLLLLGDAVHCELDGRLEEMDSSLFTLDLILTLKRHFPGQVFYLLGNHDGFSEAISKGGVSQGLLWRRHVLATRGEDYLSALKAFYRRLPVVATDGSFVACHAGPPRRAVDRGDLRNLRGHPDLLYKLITVRRRSPRHPAGYTAGDVRRLRRGLGLPKEAPLVVSHYPQDPDATVWLDAGDIADHHVVYSARPAHLAVLTRVDGELVPLQYRGETLSAWRPPGIEHT
jgi:hypothetical protein